MPCQGIAPAPQEERGGRPSIPPQGPVPVTGVFPAGVYLHLLETGIQAIQLSPYRADLPARRPIRLGTAAGFLACYFPRSPFRARSAIRSRDISSQSLPAARAIQQCASWRTWPDVKPSAGLECPTELHAQSSAHNHSIKYAPPITLRACPTGRSRQRTPARST